jgi:hypothetical protein
VSVVAVGCDGVVKGVVGGVEGSEVAAKCEKNTSGNSSYTLTPSIRLLEHA